MDDFNQTEENMTEDKVNTGNSEHVVVEQMNTHIQDVLKQMKDKFQLMSEQIILKIDDMGNRIDELEKNITDLMNHAGLDTPEK